MAIRDNFSNKCIAAGFDDNADKFYLGLSFTKTVYKIINDNININEY
jgi:hypothetical protein